LKLDRVSVIEVFELDAWSQTSSVKEDLVAAIVGNDETISLLSYDFFDDTGHGHLSSSFLGLKNPYLFRQIPARSCQ